MKRYPPIKASKRPSPLPAVCLLLIFGILATGCRHHFSGVKGEGEIKTEKRSLESFNKIDFRGKGQVALITGDKYAVRVETHENLLPLIETNVENGRLKITFAKRLRSKNKIRFYITAPEYNEIYVSGGVEIKSAGRLVSEELELDFSGASEGILELETSKLETSISGAGEMTFSGSADYHKITISGAGKIKALDLKTEITQLKISGAGDAEIHATEELKVKISGAGDVVYKGDPEIEKRISGAGSIKKL